MKKYFLLLTAFTLLLTGNVTAQVSQPSARKEAFIDSAYYYFQHGNYSGAIELFKQVIAVTHYTYEMETLALCYAKMDSIEQEKKALEQAINTPDNLDASAHCSETLADLYLKEKNYQQALFYYNLYGAKMSHSRMPDRNMLDYNLVKENDRSKCFEGLNMIDSAVHILTPYIFCTYRDVRYNLIYTHTENLKDSLRQDSICGRYLALLEKLHSNKEIKAEFKKAEHSFYYTEKITPQLNDYIEKEMITGFNFYGTPIIYSYYGVEYNPKEKQIPETQTFVFNKSAQFKGFRQLPLCRMIRAMPNKN